MNNWSFWILPFAALMLVSTLFLWKVVVRTFGWTFYAPLSTDYAPPSTTFFIFAIHMLGISSIMGAINIIAHHSQPACAWYDHDENAAVCMDLVDYGLIC